MHWWYKKFLVSLVSENISLAGKSIRSSEEIMRNIHNKSAIFAILLSTMVFAVLQCSSDDEKLAIGETKDLEIEGQKIGMIEQISETERHLLIDQDQDGVVEKRIVIDGTTVTRIVYPPAGDKPMKEVLYNEGNAVKVKVFSDSEIVEGVAMLENEQVTQVELPGKGKSVSFVDGSINEISDLK